MYQLNASDYEFYKDINTHNSVVGNITILENKNNENIKYKIIENIKKNINSSIIHSHKIATNLIAGDYPLLVKDKNLNLDNHVFEHYCDGLECNANSIYKSILSSALSPDIPLWETHIIYNINKDKDTAIIRRYHHCLGDSDAHGNVHNLLFDNYINKKIKINKINKINCYINHFYKIFKSYFYLLFAFLFKTNKCKKNYTIDKKQIYKGIFRAKKHKQNTVSFFSYDIFSIEKILKNNNINKLELCMYITSSIYQQLLDNPENKTVVSMLPLSYRKQKNNNHNNMISSIKINLHLNEKNNFKRLLLIKEEIKDKIKISKNGPHMMYDKAFTLDPRIKKSKWHWDLLNKATWHNSKKIYQKNQHPSFISTTTSFKKNKLQPYSVGNLCVKNVYNFSMPAKTVFSIGCSISYRFYDNIINVGIVHSVDLYPNINLFEIYFKNCIEDLRKILK